MEVIITESNENGFNLDIEQLDVGEEKFSEIVDKINNDFRSKEFANLVIQFASVYIRIYNLISYLHNNLLNKNDTIEILLMIKTEISYLNNSVYDNFRKCFLSHVDEKSNLHKIDKLDDCIDDLYVLINNQKVDK